MTPSPDLSPEGGEEKEETRALMFLAPDRGRGQVKGQARYSATPQARWAAR